MDEGFIASLFKSAIGADLASSISSFITGDEFEEGVEIVSSTLNDVLLPVASVLICIYLIVELMEKVTNDNFNTDQFIKLLIKLVFSIAVVNNASAIADTIATFGSTMTSAVAEVLLSTDSPMGTLSVTSDLGFINGIIAFVILIIPWLISRLIFLIGCFMAFSYILEVNVRSLLAPIGFADLITGGSNSNGFRYLRRLIALGLQGAIMIIILAAGSSLISNVINLSMFADAAGEAATGGTTVELTIDYLTSSLIENGNIFKVLGVQIATVGLLGSAKTIANEVIG